MAKKKKDDAESPAADASAGSTTGTATAKPKRAPGRNTKPKPPRPMPPWKVLLHNDDVNDMLFVVNTIVELTPLDRDEAILRMREAHNEKLALLLVTHKERAELYKDQFQSKKLVVTIEPVEE
jgi:ATP-dependent Clp protease adaptor protein ClpS